MEEIVCRMSTVTNKSCLVINAEVFLKCSPVIGNVQRRVTVKMRKEIKCDEGYEKFLHAASFMILS